ncbi:NAD-dependent epimerase/dehydratase family protein [Streptosporangium lutulentum]
MTDEAAVRAAMEDVQAVVHLGGLSRERPWADTLHVNVHGTYVLLEAARRAGVRQVVLAAATTRSVSTPARRTRRGRRTPRPRTVRRTTCFPGPTPSTASARSPPRRSAVSTTTGSA